MSTTLWNIRYGDSSLKLKLATACTGESETITRELVIENLVKLRFKVNTKIFKNRATITSSFSSSKHDSAKYSIVTMNIVSVALKYSEKGIHVPDSASDWQIIGCIPSVAGKDNPGVYCTMFDIYITACVVKTDIASSKLYTDIDFTDFYLTTTEGYVAVHKSLLAVHSNVLKTMLSGEWKETVEGKIKIDGVTLQTLEHLKDYLYLGIVPDDGLHSLLLVARRFLIEDLEKQCIKKLAETVLPKDLFSLIEFACENSIPELPYAILQITPDDVVGKAREIKKKTALIKKVRLD